MQLAGESLPAGVIPEGVLPMWHRQDCVVAGLTSPGNLVKSSAAAVFVT